MKTPHKHAELIKAWADGAEIECIIATTDKWFTPNPKRLSWDDDMEYRIKPESKPDIVSYVYARGGIWLHFCEEEDCEHNIKLTFDGETGKVKSAEVIE
jgi:hypothetical protein